MGHRYLAAVCCIFLLLVACSGGQGASEVARQGPDATNLEEADGTQAGGGEEGTERPEKRSEDAGGGSSRGSKGDAKGRPEGSDEPGETSDDDPAPDSEGSDTPEAKRDDPFHPGSGTYVYSQRGYEEFCNGASCDRSDLPAREDISSQVIGRSQGGVMVLTEMDADGERVVRTETLYSARRAAITSVYARFDYNGFVFENDYEPDPPVEYIHFPLRKGDAWSGRWKAEVSGSYNARVVAREEVSVSGRSVLAYKIQTSTTFRGEFDGSSETQVWIDPRTRVAVRTSGLLRLKSNFGGYNTAFQTSLLSGPRYR